MADAKKGRPSVRRASLPRVEQELHLATSEVSDEAMAWASALLERNRAALKAMGVSSGRHRGSCALCGSQGLLYRVEPNDPESLLACARCTRQHAAKVGVRQQLCDNDPAHGPAWRNPYTRRNEYFCGNCHAKTEEGVLQNRYATAARYSEPLGVRQRVICAAAGVPGTKPCQGEVKPRGSSGVLLCNGHAGKQSAAGDYFD